MFKGRNKKLFFVVAIIFSFLVLFLLFSKFINEKVDIAQKTKIFTDSLIKDDVIGLLKSKNIEYQFEDNENSADIVLSKNEKDGLEKIDSAEEFYVPVSGFWSRTENISSENLKKVFKKEITNWKSLGGENAEIKIIFLDNNEVASVIKDLGADINNFEKVSDLDKLILTVSSSKNYLSFLPIEKIDSRISTLSVDNISPIKSKDFSNYSYKTKYFLQSKKKKSEKQQKIIGILKDYLLEFKSESIEITAVGDIMLSRHVGTKIRESGDNTLPFKKLASLLSSSDITFANLESPFFNSGPPVTEGMVFKAEPETIEGLKSAGIDIVSLANNHFGNQGRKGMNYTFSHLKNNIMAFCGAGENITQAHTPSVLEKKGTKFAFLSYNEISPESYKATNELSGLAWISDKEEDLKVMEDDILRAKKENNFVIASFHWGEEYKVNPNKRQKEIAQRAINAGADIILAQHPHVVQGLEFIENKPVFYSLGNFVFDQMWSEETREGLVVNTYIQGNKVLDIDLIPIKIENFNQPRLANDNESDKILSRIISASSLSSVK